MSTTFRRAHTGLYIPRGGGGGGGGSGYAAAVIADSPWGFWKLDETSGTSLADSSGNGRTMTIINPGAQSMAQTGPSASVKAIAWPTGDACYADTAVNFSGSPGTVEVWFYLAATPVGDTPLLQAQNTGNGSIAKFLHVNTNLAIIFSLDNSGNNATSANGAVSLNTWHHAVGSVGAAGTKLRLDKVTVATRANTSSPTNSLVAGFHKKQGSSSTNPGPITMAAPAIWTSQLTDAQTDAHYDAMFA